MDERTDHRTRAAALDQARTWFEARLWFEAGQEAFLAGDFGAAIAAFREAFALTGASALLYDIAQAHRLDGDHVAAVTFYRRYHDSLDSADDCRVDCACTREPGSSAELSPLLEPHWVWSVPSGYDAPER